MQNSPYTFAQFLIGRYHFFVACIVDRYRAFSNALSLGNTLLCLFSFLYVLFRLSIAFVVYITFRTSDENLNIGVNTSQFCFQLLIAFGYFSFHFSETLCKVSRPCASFWARYMLFKSVANAFLSLYGTYLRVFLIWCNIQRL